MTDMTAQHLPLLHPISVPLIQLRATLRLARLGLHLFWGCFTITAIFPFIDLTKRRWLKQRWSRQLLQVLGVDLQVSGPAPKGLVVANHISFLDIFAINAAAPAAFVSKDDVLNWPIIGWLSRHTETLFMARGSRNAAQRTREALVAHLVGGHLAALFPEGTTSDGHTVLPFHGALFQSAIDAGVPVSPVALRYRDHQHSPSPAPAYIGDISLGQCLWSIASSTGLVVEMRMLPPHDSRETDRRHLAAHCHHGIDSALKH